jgi:guanylate kinase
MSGTLYIISAASGTGKTSLVNALIKSFIKIKLSVSYTTRPNRSGEKDGVDYHFVTQKQFDKMKEEKEFLEYATVFGKNYATSKTQIEENLKAGIDVILEIDWQGAQQVRKLIPNTIGIFILPPSKEALKQRILNRNQDDSAVINQRLKAASDEISHYTEYEYLIVNDDFNTALSELKAIVLSQLCRQTAQSVKLEELLTNLIN